MAYHFERESRTPHSECFIIENDEGDQFGRVDLHFTPSGIAHATLCVPADMNEDDLQDLIGEIDDRLVTPADPFREDFVVSVWRGQTGGVYSEDDLDEELDEEGAANGHNGRH